MLYFYVVFWRVCKVLLLSSNVGARGGVGVDEGFFGIGSDDLDVNMILAGEEESMSDGKTGEALFLFIGKLEDIREDINGGIVLF